jgi:Protein of unknown function (DUF1236)
VKPFIAAAAFALFAAPAFAQVSETVTTTISPADETQMREYVIHEHHAAVPPPTGFEISTGAVVPRSVELYRFPAEHHWNYEYTTFGDRTVLVEPGTRKIIRIIH